MLPEWHGQAQLSGRNVARAGDLRDENTLCTVSHSCWREPEGTGGLEREGAGP